MHLIDGKSRELTRTHFLLCITPQATGIHQLGKARKRTQSRGKRGHPKDIHRGPSCRRGCHNPRGRKAGRQRRDGNLQDSHVHPLRAADHQTRMSKLLSERRQGLPACKERLPAGSSEPVFPLKKTAAERIRILRIQRQPMRH